MTAELLHDLSGENLFREDFDAAMKLPRMHLQLSPDAQTSTEKCIKSGITPYRNNQTKKAEDVMRIRRFDNFGDLYRAALAENNPELKQKLLTHVKNMLDVWAEADRNRTNHTQVGKPPVPANRTSVPRVA